MTSTHTLLGHIAFGAIFLIALDWAGFERFEMIVGAFGDEHEIHYRELPVIRFVAIVVSAGIIGLGVAVQSQSVVPFWAGTTVFVCAHIYGDILALKR